MTDSQKISINRDDLKRFISIFTSTTYGNEILFILNKQNKGEEFIGLLESIGNELTPEEKETLGL
jgi:hypothetical protein